MANLLALSWNRRCLSGIAFTAGSITPRILGRFTTDWPEGPPTAAWLRQKIQAAGIDVKQVAVALPREDAVLRLLELPRVSDDELPTLVRFQAAARSTQSIDQLLLDYLPMPERPGIAQKDVWLATTLQTTVIPIQSLLTEAGLELVHLTISSLCLAELITRSEIRQSINDQGSSLVVLRSGSRMELAVICERQLIAAHAVKWPSEHEAPPVTKLLSEVSRVLVQVQAWLPAGTLQRAWLIGNEKDLSGFSEAIEQRWHCPTRQCDPAHEIQLSAEKPPGDSSEYAIAAGLALLLSGAQTPGLDLLHPRQPAAKRDLRKPYIAAAAAAGLLVLAFGTAIVTQSLASYDRQIDKLVMEDNKLSGKLKQGEPTLEAAKVMNDWQAHNIDQLKQVAELYRVMNGTQRIVISDYRFSQGTGPVLAKLKIIGNARDRVNSAELAQNLADLKKFKIRPSAATAISRDPEYVSRLDFEMDLVPQTSKPLPATKENPAKPTTKKIKS